MSAPDAREAQNLRAEILALWKQHGGRFHGPHVEHATATEVNFYAFAEALLAAAVAVERQRCATVAEERDELGGYVWPDGPDIATAIRAGDPTK